MVLKFKEFTEKTDEKLNEKSNNGNVIDVKMSELKELVGEHSGDYENFIYKWGENDDEKLIVNFLYNNSSLKFEFFINDLILTKIESGELQWKEKINSIDEALDIIEKDIQKILGISEKNNI